MAWKFDKPLYSLSTEDQNDRAKAVWEGENLGGITEDNNRLPQPVVALLILTIITAFLVTAPLWGQRPKPVIYEEYVALMDTPQVKNAVNDKAAMQYIVDTVKANGSEWLGQQKRHPVSLDDLKLLKAQIIELQRQGVDLEQYFVVGDKISLSTHEAGFWGDGSSRVQPSWDLGYTIDVFYVLYFCIAVTIVVKRLPNHDWKPDHSKSH